MASALRSIASLANSKTTGAKKVVVIGGTGLIGSQIVKLLEGQGHEAIAASPKTGVDTISGQGLSEALKGAQVIIDVSNSPSFEEKAVLDFFTSSTNNLIKHGKDAGIEHFVALSIVGTTRTPHIPYFRAKLAQENLIIGSRLPYSIVHATQFFEFFKGIADGSTKDGKVYLSRALIQPIAGEEVAKAVQLVAVGKPLNGHVEIAGPEVFGIDEFVRIGLKATGDKREIVIEKNPAYYGAPIEERSIIPLDDKAKLGDLRFSDWLARTTSKSPQ